MRDELDAVLAVTPDDATATRFRGLILDENAARKRSATARMWAWKRLKLRYALDRTGSVEFRAFLRAYRTAASSADRGLVVGLMLARTDRLFREMTLSQVSPFLTTEPRPIDPLGISAEVDNLRQRNGLEWSPESLHSVTNHLISSWRETGLIASGRGVTTSRIGPGPVVAAFAAALAKAQGLTDRGVLGSMWFRLLGADEARAAELLRDAAAAGILTFRFQADVAEIQFVDSPWGIAP